MNDQWVETDNTLTKTFKFSGFLNAINWMQEASILIDKENHHPEWTNVYNKVIVKLTTHDAGNKVTDKDRRLSILLDAIPIK